jgi:hypothetical protein
MSRPLLDISSSISWKEAGPFSIISRISLYNEGFLICLGTLCSTDLGVIGTSLTFSSIIFSNSLASFLTCLIVSLTSLCIRFLYSLIFKRRSETFFPFS